MYGKKKGLQLILDQHSNMDSPATVFDNDNGFKIFIGQPTEFPLLTSEHLLLPPGQQHHLRLAATHLSTADGVKQLPSQERGCLFPEEQPAAHPLAFYSEYSMKTCLFECSLLLAATSLGCTPWYLPSLPNSTMCSPWAAATFTRALESTPPSSCSHCLPNCEATTYTVIPSAAPIRACDSRNLNLNPFCNLTDRLSASPWLGEVTSLYGAGDSVPGYIQDITEATRPAYKYKEDEQMDVLLPDKVSDTGALFGLSCVQQDKSYRALDRDVALVNIYWGDVTVMGRQGAGRAVVTPAQSINKISREQPRRYWWTWQHGLVTNTVKPPRVILGEYCSHGDDIDDDVNDYNDDDETCFKLGFCLLAVAILIWPYLTIYILL